MASLTAKLLHVCIAVPDITKALKFYCDVLGFESAFATDNGDADGVLLGFDREVVSLTAHHVVTAGATEQSATAINLVEFTDPRTDTDDGPYHRMNHAGLTRLALLVDDVDDAFEAIASHDGVHIVCSPREIVIRQGQDTHRSRWFSFRDPFGVFITATQADQPEAKDDHDG
ncbi:VOC family protein [Candidatus Mycobacterium methanotrophicum]|uniref:VOC family protein n=1 Tax=Candidatus Mycobacterium methanotrophicum TaxID=2943498 RepID=A0ABY4QJ45_9MYCO|nr:VOC family protein [Candidatus Mycobacterium methanotrophicum]UQX10993.1 VOC family protein [Candidatus Mycobacterium methanotrophicum]